MANEVILKGKIFQSGVPAMLLSEFLQALHSVAITAAESDPSRQLSNDEIETLDMLSRWGMKTSQLSKDSTLKITFEEIPPQ